MKYKFNFKETFNIGKKFFQEYVFNTLTLRSALLSLLFSIIVLLLSNPQFSVSATLLENKEKQQSSGLQGIAARFQEQDQELYQKFRANIFSSATAQELLSLPLSRRKNPILSQTAKSIKSVGVV